MNHQLALSVSLVALLAASVASAHEGHSEAPGAQAAAGAERYEVEVSAEARKNLELMVAAAEIRPLETVLNLTGEIVALPERSGAVASRIAGRVASVLVAEGDAVKRGQAVVTVESLLLGDPPPRATYTAPLSGVVIDRHIVAGDAVEPNAHLLEIADLEEVLAIGRVFEGQVARVRSGQGARVVVPAFPDRTFEGAVERVGGQLDVSSRSIPVYVRLKNADGALRPHMQASIALVTERSSSALTVPRSAILGEFGSLFVFVESDRDPTRFERRPIARGASDDRFAEVLDGVVPGDRVVTAGGYQLQFLPPATEDEEKEHAAAPLASAGPGREASALPVVWIAAGTVVVLAVALLALRWNRRRSLEA